MRQPLIEGQGNFGAIDGDPPAAMRYTEARMTQATVHMLADLEYETVNFVPNCDNSREEPTVLPGKFPNLLVNGGTGIAVGMATNMPPHNVGEVCDALLAFLDHPDIALTELMQKLPVPDFPTGGQICGRRGILDAYSTGRGSVVVRGRRGSVASVGARGSLAFRYPRLPSWADGRSPLPRLAHPTIK